MRGISISISFFFSVFKLQLYKSCKYTLCSLIFVQLKLCVCVLPASPELLFFLFKVSDADRLHSCALYVFVANNLVPVFSTFFNKNRDKNILPFPLPPLFV